ncbi:2,3-butanediol dehydrogenase [Streptomyces malaysiensis]|uniref:2,3-butanediol dehydrogenase n=1 Tax=Streptomyces malaysiensis subsp. samsunensis TaxID=459658 RepID=A0A9X2RU45_STRMQ|nr:2,3-butanediol dehydrogenase [Streptomyces samsunensis]MCQ8828720.1 2,3-butanediol dehydrogenase [Streptomyces samsunensis]
MRAARFHGRGDIRIEEIPEPAVRPGTVKIKVDWCGICGTDLHEYLDGPIFCPVPGEPHPMTGETSPVVLGHEFAGTVAEVAPDVDGLGVGERVTVEPRLVCRSCPPCLAGHHNSCDRAATIGLAGGGGGLAEYIVVDRELVFPLGELTTETGALIEPLAVAHHAVARAGIAPGARAVVFGAGPIGLLIVALLEATGAGHITVVEPSAGRRGRALEAGADVAIDPLAENVDECVRRLTGGAGADVAFECAGVDSALAGCVAAVRARGTVVNVAIRSHPATLDMIPLVLKEVRLVGTICYAGDHRPVIDLLRAGRLSVDRFITGRIDLEDLVEGGFQALLDGTGDHIKILVRPGGRSR